MLLESRPRRVALVAPDPVGTPGGMAQVINELLDAPELRQAGWELLLVPSHTEGKPRVKIWATGRGVAALWRHRRQLGVVHIHAATGWSIERKTLFALAARALRIPVLVQFHGADQVSDYETGSALHRRAFRLLGSLAQCNLLLGKRLSTWAGEALGRGNVRVLPNFVAIPPEPPPLTATPTIAFIGRIGERKGTWDFLTAAESVLKSGTAVQFVLAGDGDVAQARALVAQNPLLRECVRITGWIGRVQISKVLDETWAVVLPSYAEGLPMVILEAMARGRGVIATDVGAVAEAVTHGVNGVLVEPGDIGGLASAILSIATDRERANAYGRAGREIAEDQFARSRVLPELIARYEEALTSG